MKIAVIDLGTNGFRLYIAETLPSGACQIVKKISRELKLASEGIEHIGNAPFARGLETMRDFAEQIRTQQVEKVRAFGTAALRIADNGQQFIAAVAAQTGIQIELISGAREAELIYKGMRLGYPLGDAPVLMIDVGGGSIEFIIADQAQVFWSHSFNIGVAILKQHFHAHDRITPTEIAALTAFLVEQTPELRANIAQHQPKIPLIASGTVDTWVKILNGGYDASYFEIPKATLDDFYQKYIFAATTDWANVPEIPDNQKEMLAVSLVFMDWVMQQLPATALVASAHSMKHGILYEMSM